MSKLSQELGDKGERLACEFLKKNNYRIIKRNYRTKLGQVDIIARDRDTLCFIEVKTRTSDAYGLPQDAVSELKKRKLSKLALLYLKENRLLDKRARFDVVCVFFKDRESKIDLIKDAFTPQGPYAY